MKSTSKMIKVVVWSLAPIAFVLIMLSLRPAAAQAPIAFPDFDYNFETLVNNQLLFGQDQWANAVVGNVAVRTGPGVNQTQTAKGEGGSAGTGAIRPLDHAFYYTDKDTNVVWGVWGYAPNNCCNKTAIGGILPVIFGPHQLGGITQLTTFLQRQSSPTQLTGDVLLHDHWYEYRVSVDFSVHGGLATLSYRDVTGGATVFTNDSVIQNVNLGLVPDGSGRYGFFDVFIRNDGAAYVDNLHFDAPTGACVPPPSGMVGWWPGDGNAIDIIADHNGILEGSVTFTPGKVGRAFRFNGNQSDGVNLGDVADFDFTPTSSFSVDAWINISALAIPPDDGQNIVILNYACSNTVQALAIQITGKAFFLVRDVNGLESFAISPSAVSINTWHHIAGVREVTGAGKMVKLFIDGALVASAPDMSTGSLVNNVPDYIGRRNTCGTNNPFNGLIDEVEIFNRALNGCEIQAIYNAGSAGKCQTVVPPTQAIQNLITTVGNIGLPSGVATSLTAPLSNIDTNNQAAACNKLNAFINQVNAKVQNGQLTSCQASQLLQSANAVKASLGC